jgi:biofilm PGA synthesis protein PgaA
MLNTNFTMERYRLIDAAMAENLELIAQAKAANETDVLLRLRRDRIVALRDRGLNQQAIDEFRILDAEEGATPAYVVAATADACLNQRLPKQAAELYKRALQGDPGNTALTSGLMYAELDAENFPGAERIVGLKLRESENAPAARRTQALLLRFADRLDDAQIVMQALIGERPDDVGVWLEQGDLFLRRGLPRAAAERYQAVLAVEPTSIKARVGLSDALWAQGAVADAASLIARLKAEAPQHPAVQRLLRAWQRKARPLLTSSVTKGFGQGQVAGNDDLVWESTLFSGQSEAGVRGFVNHHLANASFNDKSASHERIGAGLEWTQRDVQATIELGRDLRNGQDAVWAAGAAWQLNDQVSMRVRHESQTNDFPLKGRLPDAEGYLGAPTYLHSSKTLVGAAYRWNESRRVAADFADYKFNDGNHRQSLSASWFERLYSGYGRTLDLQAAGYSSTNTMRDAIYFNPKRDVAWSATLAGDWLTWRRYERSFNQRLALTLGTYSQTSDVNQSGNWISQRYGWNSFEEIRYEHEWQWGPDFSTRYGIGARRFPYDGVNETKSYVYALMNWRL